MSWNNSNDSGIQISGNDSTVALRQTGIAGGNNSGMVIDGSSNVVFVTQRADSNAANASMISIVRNGSTSVVTQSTGP